MFSSPLAVLNPGGRDREQRFPDGAGEPGEGAHPPVNYHAFAACTGGGFYRDAARIPAEQRRVLVLLRSDLRAGRAAVRELRRAGKTVAVALKEAGGSQVAAFLARAGALSELRAVCAAADGALAATEDGVPLFHAAGAARVAFIPTPYPVEDARWDFSGVVEARRGILVGTREWFTPSRRHAAALLAVHRLAESSGEPVTVVNGDGWRGRRLLRGLGFPDGLLRVQEGRLAYPDYLRLLARHRLVFQLDASGVPGQVAGDALLCRVPCVGGDGATERLGFPDHCGHGRSAEELVGLAARLLEHPAECAEAAAEAVARAGERLGFAAGARALDEFFARLEAGKPGASGGPARA